MRCFYALALALILAPLVDANGGLFARRQVVRVRQVVQVERVVQVQKVFQVQQQYVQPQRIVVPYQPVLQVQSYYAPPPVLFQQQANYCAPAAAVVAPAYSVQSFAVRRCH